MFQGRPDLLKYAEQHNIPVSATPKAPWSMDANFMHVSYESGILEDPATFAPEDLFQMTASPHDAPNTPSRLSITFQQGLPVMLKTQDNIILNTPITIFTALNDLGGRHGVGRIDIVENRFIGLKVIPIGTFWVV